MSKKKEEKQSVYSVLSVIEKPHISTWAERDNLKAFGVSQYKVLIEDEDGECLLVSALNDTDLAEMASEGFFDGKDTPRPLEFNVVTVEDFNNMVETCMEIHDFSPLESFDEAIHMIVETDTPITRELADYFADIPRMQTDKNRPLKWVVNAQKHTEEVLRIKKEKMEGHLGKVLEKKVTETFTPDK